MEQITLTPHMADKVADAFHRNPMTWRVAISLFVLSAFVALVAVVNL